MSHDPLALEPAAIGSDSEGPGPAGPRDLETPTGSVERADAAGGAARGASGSRARAALEVLLCSGVPTQLVIGQMLTLAGWPPFSPDGTPRLAPLVALALADTVFVIVLIALLLHAGGERLRPLLGGTRPALREGVIGVMLVPVLFVGVGVTVLLVRALLPWSHNVPLNPFEEFLKTPTNAGVFAVVAIIAGGLREEVQRVFLLHRFEHYLGGATVGLVVVSLAFGAGHAMQGWDASIATGLLGLTWGWIYLRRRSAVAPIVSHAGYNAAQILQAVAVAGMRT